MDEKQYIKSILLYTRCGFKKKKELYNILSDIVVEKKENGMNMKEIMTSIGTPEEVACELNVYLLEKKQCMDQKTLKIYKTCKYLSYAAIIGFCLIVGYIFIKQNSILRFLTEQNSSTFVAGSSIINIQVFVLILLAILIAILFGVKYVIKRKYMWEI
ncbi:hypothetical protein [Robinsoniella peoriensis]|uniref:hypothetical protein n=1 Tax=Robinsoniella peoriensis TaxID=180332 RepID=UPI00085BFDDE|nr:hypothetical protein [Robinsoniella peoriensis]